MDLSGQTSAQIISEARASLKSVKLSRPITPAPSQLRTLWGDAGQDATSRPPSVHRLSRVPFVPSHKRPTSSVRLAPISQSPSPRPPLPSRTSSRSKSARHIRKSHSMEQIHIPTELRESLSLLDLFSDAASTSWKEDRLKNALALLRSYLIDRKDEGSTAILVEQISDSLLAPVFKIIQALHSSPSMDAFLLLLACAVAIVAYGSMRSLSSANLANLSTICQVIFSVARDEKFDSLFMDTDCTDGMLFLLSRSNNNIPEYLVYLLGTFKLLVASGNSPSSLTESYLSLVIPLSSALLRSSDQEYHPLSAPCLLQVSWSLRSLCDSQIALLLLTSTESVLLVTNMLKIRDETSVYAAKVCSKLASNNHFQRSLLSLPAALDNMLSAIPLNAHSPLITTRLAYTLSKLVMDDVNASTIILSLPRGVASVLETVSTLSLLSAGNIASVSALYSLVGNLALHPDAGRLLSSYSSLSRTLISSLDDVTENVPTNLEFLAVLLIALNNLSYYQLDAESSQLLTLSLIHLLLLPSIPLHIIQQAVCCLGNLTRRDECRTSVRESNTDLFLLALLDSTDTDILFSTTGVIINLTSRPECTSSLLDNGLVGKMLSILELVGRSDLSVISNSCQILWNVASELEGYCARHKEGRGQCEEFKDLLCRILDPVTQSLSGEVNSELKVGNNLLDRMKHLLI